LQGYFLNIIKLIINRYLDKKAKIMTKIFANWLMDIAKYVITALVLSTALGLQEQGWIYYVICVAFVVIVVSLAFVLYRKDQKTFNIRY